MGKLVLGIIAIGLLQIAFLTYSTIDQPARVDADVARTVPLPKRPDLSRATDTPEITAAPSPSVPDIKDPSTSTVGATASTERPAGTRRRANVADWGDRIVRDDTRIASASYASSISPATSVRLSSRKSPAIPSGYTMVLVDYLPTTSNTKTPPVTARNKMAVTRDSRTNDVPKGRKRPFLARAGSALVRKPWNWIKSVASKMD